MALFGTKKNTKKEIHEVKKIHPTSLSISTSRGAFSVIRRPRVTEKATRETEMHNVYTFEIEPSATKRAVFEAIRTFYKVTPKKVHIAKNPRKRLFVRGKQGSQPAVKKAYVYLKKGEKIDLI